jgi:hypothetical protein
MTTDETTHPDATHKLTPKEWRYRRNEEAYYDIQRKIAGKWVTQYVIKWLDEARRTVNFLNHTA